MTRKYEVCRATHEDVLSIAELCGLFSAEFMPDMPYDPTSFGCLVQNWIQNAPNVRVWVLRYDAEVIGFSIGMVTPLWFNPAVTQFSELAWFVHPDYRGRTGSGAVRLLLALREDAAALGADYFGATAEADGESLVPKLYGKLGMKHQESMYVMPLGQGG
jgi:hypothetical protein